MSLQIIRRETVGPLVMRVVSRPAGYYLVVKHENTTTALGIMWLARDLGQAMRRVDLRIEQLTVAA